MRTRRPTAPSAPPPASAAPSVVPFEAHPHRSHPRDGDGEGGRESLETLAAIGPIARSSVVDAVADRLQDEILSGRLVAGARLPSEREFSLALGVNRL
ncbi:MAG TPA: GntR family transcriptional regulator, partial [Polyangiaceae bacterium]|nr:GntR family transcriptional regulator [Polyangiaceae bacterium]